MCTWLQTLQAYCNHTLLTIHIIHTGRPFFHLVTTKNGASRWYQAGHRFTDFIIAFVKNAECMELNGKEKEFQILKKLTFSYGFLLIPFSNPPPPGSLFISSHFYSFFLPSPLFFFDFLLLHYFHSVPLLFLKYYPVKVEGQNYSFTSNYS